MLNNLILPRVLEPIHIEPIQLRRILISIDQPMREVRSSLRVR